MKLRMVLITFLMLTTGQKTLAKVVLQDVEARFDGSTFVTELKFNRTPQTKDILIEYINQTIQVNLPAATVKSGKILKRVDQENIRSVYSYQYDKDLLRTRIIYAPPIPALDYEGFVKVERKGKSLLINVYDPVMAKNSEMVGDDLPMLPPVDLARELEKKALSEKNQEEDSVTIVAKELSKEVPQVLPEKKNVAIADSTLNSNSQVLHYNKNATFTEGALKARTAENSTKSLFPSKEQDTKSLQVTAKEKDIPLFLNKEKVQKAEESTYTRLIYSLFIIIALGVGVVAFSKWWAKNHKVNDKNTKIQVLSQHHLGPKKSLLIIRVAGESHLLGVTDHNVNMLKTLSFIDDEVLEEMPRSFDEAMQSEDSKKGNSKALPKVTFSPDEDLVANIHNQISGKLKQLKDI